jgi:hypothetical protein
MKEKPLQMHFIDVNAGVSLPLPRCVVLTAARP